MDDTITPHVPNPLMTSEEVQAAFGGVCDNTVRALAREGQITALKVRRAKRYTRESVDAYIARQVLAEAAARLNQKAGATGPITNEAAIASASAAIARAERERGAA